MGLILRWYVINKNKQKQGSTHSLKTYKVLNLNHLSHMFHHCEYGFESNIRWESRPKVFYLIIYNDEVS